MKSIDSIEVMSVKPHQVSIILAWVNIEYDVKNVEDIIK